MLVGGRGIRVRACAVKVGFESWKLVEKYKSIQVWRIISNEKRETMTNDFVCGYVLLSWSYNGANGYIYTYW
jgi:hypothetical protein